MKRLRELLGMVVEKKDLGHLPLPARVYISAICAAAAAIAAYCGVTWENVHIGQFLLYVTAGILCSNLKVSLPGVTGTLSVNYLFILTAVAELTLPETVIIGCTSGVAQLYMSARKRPRSIQILFAFAGQTICSAATYAVYHAAWPGAVPFRLLEASTVYFLANTGSVCAIVCLTEGKSYFQVWRSTFFWTAPHYLAGGALAGAFHFWNEYAGWQTAVLVFPIVYLVYHSYRLYLGQLEEEKRHVGEMADLHLRTIQALALAIDARDGTTFGHLRRVQVYAREMARELGLSEDERRALDAAALLHDIGKLAVPEYIISKPGKLSKEEFEKMKVHPIVGAEILDSVQFPYPVVPIVRAHHEKWDGTGYPYGLKGEEIPIGARIVAAVDCLDALASDRQYRRALPLDEAMRQVAKESGKTFDPRVVEILQKRYREFEQLARQQTAESVQQAPAVSAENGAVPAAGFEPATAAPAVMSRGFIDSIASARQEFQTLLELSNDLGRSLRVDDTLALLASKLKALVPHDGIAIFTVSGDRLVTRYAAGDDAALLLSLEIPMGEGISGWVVQNNKPIVNGNPSVEPGYLNDPAKYSLLSSALSVPLPGLKGVIGALTLYHREPAAFNKDHLRVLLAISSKAGLTIENALQFVQVEKSAVTDGLTGLPNARSLFRILDSTLKEASEKRLPVAVLVTDMDGFKRVNDQHGHAAGNRVLQRTAEILMATCRKGDYVARMGGDEFVLLLPGGERQAISDRAHLLNQLVVELGKQVCGEDFLRLSIGAAYYPEDGIDAEELLAIADARMYEMKRRHHAEAVDSGESGNLARLAEALGPATERDGEALRMP